MDITPLAKENFFYSLLSEKNVLLEQQAEQTRKMAEEIDELKRELTKLKAGASDGKS